MEIIKGLISAAVVYLLITVIYFFGHSRGLEEASFDQQRANQKLNECLEVLRSE